jgi:hypothetical protein
MKRVIFALAAVVALVACSKEQTLVQPEREAIGFGTPFVENSTRVDYSTTALTEFYVYGTVTGTAGTVNIFDGDKVTKTQQVGTDIGDTNTWWYAASDAQYWIPKASYNFAAVVDATVGTNDTAYGMPVTLTTQADNAMNLKDMLYATSAATVNAEGTPSVNPVAFTFAHLLSKAHFTVTSNATGDYSHTVTGIKIASFESGTYTIANDSWVGSTTAKDVEFAEIKEVTYKSGAKSNAEMLLVPNANTFKVTFIVDLYKGTTKLGTETKTVEVSNDLVKGNSYNFTIECSVGNPIKFGVNEEQNWGWGDTTDVTIQ